MPLGLQAIRPKRNAVIDATRTTAALVRENTRYAQKLQQRLQKYPAQRPTSYRRTGDLGRGWTAPGALKVTPSGFTLVNRIHYAVYVEGPKNKPAGERQTAVMRRKGWPSISDVAREERKAFAGIVNKAIKGRPG